MIDFSSYVFIPLHSIGWCDQLLLYAIDRRRLFSFGYEYRKVNIFERHENIESLIELIFVSVPIDWIFTYQSCKTNIKCN